MLGLLGRAGLAPGRAIILRPASSIHTMWMRFPLDVLFLDVEQRVMKVERSMKPFRFSSARAARDVIEMAGGSLPQDVIIGDVILITQNVPDLGYRNPRAV